MRKYRNRTILLLLLLVGEFFAFFTLQKRMNESRTAVGFLTKKGPAFVVAWRDRGDSRFFQSEHATVASALKFATETLQLKLTPNLDATFDMERVWMEDRGGASVVFWKLENHTFLNQLTFHNQVEAKFFEAALRKGSYTPSPVGHALLLSPQKVGPQDISIGMMVKNAVASVVKNGF